MKAEYVRLKMKWAGGRTAPTWHRVSRDPRRVQCGVRMEGHSIMAVRVAEVTPEPFCSHCARITAPVHENTVVAA